MTKSDFLVELKAHNTGIAVAMHIRKVEKMTDAEFTIHHSNLIERKSEREASVKKMTRQVLRRVS